MVSDPQGLTPHTGTPMANNAPQPRPGIMSISAYVPGESEVESGIKPIKLSSNETPLGPSPKAIAAYKAEADRLERYPDGASTALRKAVARRYGLDPARIVCGRLGRADQPDRPPLLGPGDEVLITAHAFAMFKILALASGATPIEAPQRDYTADVDALLERVTPRTRSCSSPIRTTRRGPTSRTTRCAGCTRLPSHTPVLDAAYGEYVRRNDYEAGLELVANNANAVMLRTSPRPTASPPCGSAGRICPQAWPRC